MARDAQLAGDRVQTEYYLQFADHYFRVLSESRARFEDQRRARGEDLDDDDMDNDGDDDLVDADGDDGEDQRSERHERSDRNDRPERSSRGERQDRGDRQGQGERAERSDRSDRQDRPSRRPRRAEGEDRPARVNDERPGRGQANGVETMPFDALPPAIGRDEDGDAVEDAPKPRRRARTPRAEAPQDSSDAA